MRLIERVLIAMMIALCIAFASSPTLAGSHEAGESHPEEGAESDTPPVAAAPTDDAEEEDEYHEDDEHDD